LDGSLDKKLKSGKKKKKESIREAIDMKKKNCLHFGVISQNVVNSKNINLTQRFKTPRDDDKKKWKPIKLREDKENSTKNCNLKKFNLKGNASFKLFWLI